MSHHLAKVQLVNVREGWPSEDGDFTPWLAANISELGRALGLEFTGVRTEERLYGGSRRVDIVAACDGRPVVIENQLEDTDNDHLSRLLIYAAGKDAKTVIWIAAGMDDEHWQVMHWLNQQNGNAKFYGVVVELLKVSDSKPAPYFKVVVAPGDMRERNTGNLRWARSQNDAFSQGLAEELRSVHNINIPKEGKNQPWDVLEFLDDWTLRYVAVWFTQPAVEFVIEKRDSDWSQNLLKELEQHKSFIESAVAESVDEWFVWEPASWPGDVIGRSRVAIYRPGNVHNNTEEWAEYRSWIIRKYLRFREVIPQHLAKLELQAE